MYVSCLPVLTESVLTSFMNITDGQLGLRSTNCGGAVRIANVGFMAVADVIQSSIRLERVCFLRGEKTEQIRWRVLREALRSEQLTRLLVFGAAQD